MKLENKVAIVTGAGSGMGKAIAGLFAKEGAKVIASDINETGVKDLIASSGDIAGEIVFSQTDVSNRNQVETMIDLAVNKYGKLDVLVNNAGVAKLTPFAETTDEIRDFHFDINIKGAWNMSQEVLPYMPKDGAIVNLSSVTGTMVADTGEVAYATTKAALLGFTKGLAAEVVNKGIRVNAILPGYIMTPMVEGIAKDSDSSNPNGVVEGIAKGIPMGRLGTIEELGELAAFLASNEASYITGQSFVIDGGSTLPETMSVGV